jgi:SAM-dependent methyltransferase
MVWQDGYVSEINYTYGFYGELSPLKLAFTSLIKAVQYPDCNKEFTYCELGCGQGYSSNLLASTYPQAQFYATDFNPNHIAGAKALAQAAETANIHFFEDSFEDFIKRDLPNFDFICIHGTYSWISQKHRQNLVNFIRQKIKTGGMLYISYNALPGWAAAMPLRELMIRHAGRTSQPLVMGINQSLEFIEQLFSTNPAYLAQNPALTQRFDGMKNHSRNYLAHEYFNQDWHPFYFDQVVKELEEAKVQYLASSNILDHLEFLNLSQAAQKQLFQIPDPIYREVVRDYFLNTQFRKDIFLRGMVSLTRQEKNQQLQQTRFALLTTLSAVKLQQQFPIGKVTLQESIYMPICQALTTESLSFGQLQNHPLTKDISPDNLFQALLILSGLSYIHPAVDAQTYKQRKKYTNSFNAAVKAKALYSNNWQFLASPVIGTGVSVNRIEQLFLLAKSSNQDMVRFAWEVFASQGQNLIEEGKVLTTPEENIARLKKLAEEFAHEKLKMLQNLGID